MIDSDVAKPLIVSSIFPTVFSALPDTLVPTRTSVNGETHQEMIANLESEDIKLSCFAETA